MKEKPRIVRLAPLPGHEACDFCWTRPVVAWYDAKDFQLDPRDPLLRSLGMWAACEECMRYVDAGRWDDLIERATGEFISRHPILRNHERIVREQVAGMYTELRRNLKKAS